MNHDELILIKEMFNNQIVSIDDKLKLLFESVDKELANLRVDNNDAHQEIKLVLKEHNGKIDRLSNFKVRVIAIASVISAILAGAISIGVAVLKIL